MKTRHRKQGGILHSSASAMYNCAQLRHGAAPVFRTSPFWLSKPIDGKRAIRSSGESDASLRCKRPLSADSTLAGGIHFHHAYPIPKLSSHHDTWRPWRTGSAWSCQPCSNRPGPLTISNNTVPPPPLSAPLDPAAGISRDRLVRLGAARRVADQSRVPRVGAPG